MSTFDGGLVAEWSRHRVPRGLAAAVLYAGWVAIFVMSVVGDSGACTPKDPGVCGPDPAFGWSLGVFFSVLVLAAVAPVMACLAGVAFSLVDVLYDSEPVARLAFGGYAVVCVSLGWFVIQRRRAQRRVFAATNGTRPVVSRGKVPPMDRTASVCAALLLLGLAGGWAVYHQRTTAEAAHLRVAQRQEAAVTSVDESNDVIGVRLPDGTSHRIEVLETAPYSRLTTTPVLVDPSDPSWVRLVAEPADFTMWLSGASCCGVLLLLLLAWQAVGARARWHLLSSPRDAVTVRVSLASPRKVNIHPFGPGSARPVASFVAAAPPGEVALMCAPATTSADNPWRHLDSPDLRTATVIGDFTDGGWVALVGQDGALLPRTTLHVARGVSGDTEARSATSGLARRFGKARRSGALETTARTVYQSDPDVKVPQLPLSVAISHGAARALRGWLVALAGLGVSAVPAAMSGRENVPWQFVLAGAYFFVFGTAMLRARIVLTHRGFEFHGGWRTYIVPWSRVTEVARSGNRLLVALPNGVLALPELSRSELSQRLDEVGRAMTALRDRAKAVGAPSGAVRIKFGSAWPAVGVYVVVVGLAFALGRIWS